MGLLFRTVVLALCVASCGRMPPVATAADAERGNVELAELHQGRKLLIRKCGNCHRPPLPDAARRWRQPGGMPTCGCQCLPT